MDKELYVRKNWLSAAPELNDREAEEAFAVCVETVKRNMAYFGRSFPAAASVDGIYPKRQQMTTGPTDSGPESCGFLTRRRKTLLLSGRHWLQWQTLNGA